MKKKKNFSFNEEFLKMSMTLRTVAGGGGVRNLVNFSTFHKTCTSKTIS